MKTRNILFGLFASLLAFAGCEIVEIKDASIPDSVGSSFELVADIVQTKTTVDPENGYKVSWEEGDVIYMVTDDETWGKPYESSSVTNIETIAEFVYGDGKFTSEATIGEGAYTFNAMYCDADNKSWHRGAGSTHKLLSTQSQDCSDPTAHIKNYDALVGTFTATVPVENPQNVAMHHIYALMQVNVKNSTGEDIEIAEFEMSASGTELAGIFTIEDFAAPSITAKSGLSESIKVQVTGGTVAAGESLPIYFVCAPFSSNENDGITFKVTDKAGNTYTKTVNKAITFSAGTYNTTPYTISAADEVEETDYSGIYAILTKRSSGDYYYMTNDLGSASTKRFTAESAGASLPEPGIELGSSKLWEVSKTDDYYVVRSVGSDKYITWTSGNSANLGDEGILFTITKTGDGLYNLMYKATDGDRYLSLNKTSGNDYFALYKSGQAMNLALIPAVQGEDPSVLTATAPGQMSAAGGAGSFTFTLTNPKDGQSVSATEELDWISDVSVAGNTVSYTVAANTSSESREGTITLKYEGVEDVEVTVTQAGKAGEGEGVKTWTRVKSIADLLSGGTFVIGYEANANSGVLVPLRSTECAATTSANGMLYSGTTIDESTNGTIDMSNVLETSEYEVEITASKTTVGAINIQLANKNYVGNSGSKNTAKLYASPSSYTDYTPTIGDNDVITLTSPQSVSTSYTTLQYNASNPRFCNYGGTQKNLVIYKLTN